MKALEFNRIYDETVVIPLLSDGFVRRGANVYLEINDTVLALLRFQGKFGALLQTTHIIVCVRHKFLRALVDLNIPGMFNAGINDYPVKEKPSALCADVSQWRYRPINLGARSDDYETIEYGKLKAASVLRPILDAIATNVRVRGRALAERLTPAEGLRQLREHGEHAWCERLWIEDYLRYFGNNKRTG